MNKDDIVGLFTLYLSGAVEMKNSKEIIWKTEDSEDVIASFPTNSSKLLVIKEYDGDTLLEEKRYKDYVYDGRIVYDADTHKKVKEDVIVDKCMIHRKTWYSVSGRKHADYMLNKDYKKVGVYKCWYSNGVLQTENEKDMDGKNIGEAFYRYSNKQLRAHEKYNNGDRVSITEWYSNGNLRRKCTPTKSEEWNKNGEKVYEQYRKNGWMITKRKENKE